MSLTKTSSFAVLALVAAATFSTANVITAQDADAASCRQFVSASGSSSAVFNRAADRRAERRAKRKWSRAAKRACGNSFGNINKAQRLTVNCRGNFAVTGNRNQQGPRKGSVCTVRAIPNN